MRLRRTLGAIGLGMLTASGAQSAELSLQVTGFNNNTGQARIILMRDEAGYHGTNDPVLVTQVPIRDHKASWVTDNIKPGNYALLVHHDSDANNKLNRPVFNLPLEPYGFSNGAWTSMGIPAWEQVSFRVGDEPAEQSVVLRMNAFAAFAQIVAVGLPSLAAIFVGLAIIRRRRRRSIST